ncbi:indolethylamine N-methyltransferase-like [Ascaphus truei]|uniref:indolethylamine N-methyltransferase-like n=1 Tax=Ascaphus truei TaxID=8439 RepID=UPI003F59E0B0
MDSNLHKHYHDEEFDPKGLLDTFFCDENVPLIDENVGFPLKKLHETFSSGRVRGDTLIDISSGASVYHLLSASDIFKEIIVIEFTEPNIQEFEKWLKKDPGAADWSYAAKAVCELEGNREEWQVKEDKVRRAVKQVVKWDVSKDNPLDPVVLPQVDCVLSLWVLHVISKDRDAYRRNLRKLTSLLNIGGHMLLFGAFNMTYYKIGEHKFFILSYDEIFLREALRDAGYVIENMDVLPSRKGCDMLDYEHLVYVTFTISYQRAISSKRKFTEPSIQEFKKWRKKDPGAADWSYAAKALCELEGNREEWQVKEDKVRRAVKQVAKWDVSKDNPLDHVILPQVDCVLSLWAKQCRKVGAQLNTGKEE